MRDETYSSAQATNAGGAPDAELPRYGLERVILIDSYLRGANTEIRVDGHTAITGANSAGKTSMIRLLPAFFGAPPRSLVKAKVGSTQKSFQDYYLPSKSSYVVFEYRTQRGLNLAVFTTHSNTTQLKIVLISGDYADDLFVGADEKYLDKDDLPTRARAAGRIVKVCTTVKGYRQIVLGDAKVRGRTTEEIGFNILAGYPNSTRRSLDGVHAVLTATLDEDIDERLLRRLLFEQAAQETNWSADAELRFNADELEEWVGNYRGLKSMLTQTERACEAIDAGQTLKYLGVREAVLHAALERAQQAVVETLNEARDYEQSNQNLLESKAAAYRQARKDHDTEHDKASGKLRDVRGEKDSLKRRQRGLLGEGAEAASVVAAELSERQTALGQAHRQLDELARQSEEIDRPIDSAIERTKTEARKALEEVQRERESVAQALQDDIEKLNADYEEAQLHLEDMLTERARALGEEERAADLKLAELKVIQQRVEASSELLDRLDETRRAFDQASDAYTEARERERAELDALRSARTEHQARAELLEDMRRRQTTLHEEQLNLRDILDRKDTLLEFLRDEVDGFEATIAATLAEGRELLYRKDLKPERATSPDESLFGVKIETTKLDAVDVDVETRGRLRAVERELSSLAEEIRAAEIEQSQASKQVRTAKQTYERAHAEARQLDSRREAMRTVRDRAEREVVEDRDRARAQVEKDIVSARQVLEAANQAVAEQQRSARQQRDAERGEHKAARRSRRERADEDRNALVRKSKRISDARDATIASWEEMRSKKRSEQGVSDDDLRRQQQAVSRAEKAVAEAEKAAELAERWSTLQQQLREQWPSLERREREALEAVADLESEWRKHDNVYQQERQTLETEIERTHRKITRLINDRDRLEGLVGTPPLLGTKGPLDSETVRAMATAEVSALERESRDIRNGFQEHSQSLSRSLSTVVAAIKRSSSRFLRDFRESRRIAQLEGGIEIVHRIEMADVLSEFFGDPGHWRAGGKHFPGDSRGEELEEVVRGAISNRIELNGFLRGIDDIRASVARQRRGIEESFQSFLESIDKIDRIEVNAQFDPHQVDGYQAAKQNLAALDRYQQRRDASGDPLKLPDDDLAEAVEGLIAHLRARRAEQKQSLEDAIQLKLAVVRLGGTERTESRFGTALRESFSSGIGLMVVVSILVGFMERLRRGYPVTIPWVLDEVLKLDVDNQRDLLRAMNKHHLFLTTTSPDIQDAIDPEFTSRYLLQTDGNNKASGTFVLQDPKPRGRDPFAMLEEDEGDDDVANGGEHATA